MCLKVLTKSECCFCLISVTGKMQQMFAPHRVRGEARRHVSHFTEYADGPNKRLALLEVHKKHGFALLRVRGHRLLSRRCLPSGDGANIKIMEHNTNG